jgi:hypothetical protein
MPQQRVNLKERNPTSTQNKKNLTLKITMKPKSSLFFFFMT